MRDRAAIEARVQSFFDRQSAGVVAVYLFGSVARGDARQASDVDLAVLLGENPPRTLDGLGLDLADELQAELGAPVQVVVLNTALGTHPFRGPRAERVLRPQALPGPLPAGQPGDTGAPVTDPDLVVRAIRARLTP